MVLGDRSDRLTEIVALFQVRNGWACPGIGEEKMAKRESLQKAQWRKMRLSWQ